MLPLGLLAPATAPEPAPSGFRCLALTSAGARRRFDVAPTLEREVVLVPDDLQARDASDLAFALHATAILSPDGRWRLERPASTGRALDAAETAWTLDQAREAAQKQEAAVRTGGTTPSFGVAETLRRARREFAARKAEGGFPDDSSIQAQSLAPAARLLADLLKNLSPATLALAPRGVTTLFSNRPVGQEQSLPVDDGRIAAYVADQDRYAEWAQGARESGEIAPDDRRFYPADAALPGGRTLIVRIARVARRPDFHLAVYDPKGRCESFASLEAQGIGFPPPPARLGRVALSDDVRRAVARATPGDAAFRPDALDPEAHDPLDGLAREALLRYARARGLARVVACVPDELLRAAADCVAADGISLDLDRFGRALADAEIETAARGGTLVVRPVHPLQEEADRIDRRSLVAEYRTIRAGRFDLDAIAAYHAAYADAIWRGTLLYDVQDRLRQAFDLASTPGWGLPDEVLAALGELSPNERRRVADGGLVRLDPTAHPVGATQIATLLSRQAGPGRSDLAKVWTRILVDPAGLTLRGTVAVATKVKRVALFEMQITERDPATGVYTTRTGKNFVFDPVYVPFRASRLVRATSHLGTPDAQYLSERFRYFWMRERDLWIGPSLGEELRAGPFVVAYPLDKSGEAVPLSEVPGADHLFDKGS